MEQECIPVGCVLPACWPYPSMHCGQGLYLPVGYLPGGIPARGVYLPGGYLPGGVPAGGCTYQGVYLPGGTYLGLPARRRTCQGGVPAGGCTYQGGTYLGVYLPGGVPAQVLPLPVDRQTPVKI